MEYIINRMLNSITYILPVGTEHDCWLVDCGDVAKIIKHGWNIKGVLLTHSHIDHIYGLNKLIDAFPDALIYTNDAGMDGLLKPNRNMSKYHDDIEDFIFVRPENVRYFEHEGWYNLSGLHVEIMFTPGHDPSCITYHVDDMLFTGDSYIPGVKVLTTLPRSNKPHAAESLARLQYLEQSGLQIKAGHWIMK